MPITADADPSILRDLLSRQPAHGSLRKEVPPCKIAETSCSVRRCPAQVSIIVLLLTSFLKACCTKMPTGGTESSIQDEPVWLVRSVDLCNPPNNEPNKIRACAMRKKPFRHFITLLSQRSFCEQRRMVRRPIATLSGSVREVSVYGEPT
jgi:hypothetical protein